MQDILAAIGAARGAGDDAALAAAIARAPESGGDAAALAAAVSRALAETESVRVRNAAALALADLDAPGAAARIAALLDRPEIARAAGTPLYALARLEGRLPLGTLVRIVRDGSFEARAEAIEFLRRGAVHPFGPEEASGASASLAEAAASPSEAGGHAAMALEAIGVLSNAPPLPAP